MKSKIKHFIVDLEEFKHENSFGSNMYVKANKIIEELEELLVLIEYNTEFYERRT